MLGVERKIMIYKERKPLRNEGPTIPAKKRKKTGKHRRLSAWELMENRKPYHQSGKENQKGDGSKTQTILETIERSSFMLIRA